MATITEDYISFETAKLLRKKGFGYNAEYESYYTFGGIVVYFKDWPQDINIAPRVTLQMAMKWLREVHSLHIWIGHAAGKVLSWYYEIHGITDGKVKHIGGMQCGSYEVACEAAIKYCLENLI